MRITFVLPTVNMSGGIRVVAIYARLLSDRGHQVVLVSPPPVRPRFKERVRRMFSSGANAAPIQSHVDSAKLDHRVLERWRPVVDADVPDADVVIATWWETAEWVAALSASKGAKAYFVQGHEVFPWLPQDRCKATYRLPMHKIVVARWLIKVMASEYADHDVDIVSNSVDHEQFHASPRAKQARPTVGFLYSEVEIKGVNVTLRAIELLRRQMPELRVVSFGTSVPDASIAAGLEFRHDPPQPTLRDIYASCDVWLTASRSEGFNLPAMEAMACRTPVVSTRTGWPEEAIVDGVNGYCVEVDDVSALAESAHRLLVLPDVQWRNVSHAAFETVRESTWERSCDLFERALVRAVEAGHPQAGGRGEAQAPAIVSGQTHAAL